MFASTWDDQVLIEKLRTLNHNCLEIFSHRVRVCACVYVCVCSVTQLCPTLCDTVDCRPPGSSSHGLLKERVLEWLAMPLSNLT